MAILAKKRISHFVKMSNFENFYSQHSRNFFPNTFFLYMQHLILVHISRKSSAIVAFMQ